MAVRHRRPAQHSARVPHVLPTRHRHRVPSNVANSVFHGFDAARFDSCGSGGRFSAHSGLHLLFDSRFEERARFSVQLAFLSRPVKESSEAVGDAAE